MVPTSRRAAVSVGLLLAAFLATAHVTHADPAPSTSAATATGATLTRALMASTEAPVSSAEIAALVALGLVVLSGVVTFLAQQPGGPLHWLSSVKGKILVSVVTGALTAASHAITASGLHWMAVLFAVFQFLANFLGMSSVAIKNGQTPQLPSNQPPALPLPPQS